MDSVQIEVVLALIAKLLHGIMFILQNLRFNFG